MYPAFAPLASSLRRTLVQPTHCAAKILQNKSIACKKAMLFYLWNTL